MQTWERHCFATRRARLCQPSMGQKVACNAWASVAAMASRLALGWLRTAASRCRPASAVLDLLTSCINWVAASASTTKTPFTSVHTSPISIVRPHFWSNRVNCRRSHECLGTRHLEGMLHCPSPLMSQICGNTFSAGAKCHAHCRC